MNEVRPRPMQGRYEETHSRPATSSPICLAVKHFELKGITPMNKHVRFRPSVTVVLIENIAARLRSWLSHD
jgi:hypothetical protein